MTLISSLCIKCFYTFCFVEVEKLLLGNTFWSYKHARPFVALKVEVEILLHRCVTAWLSLVLQWFTHSHPVLIVNIVFIFLRCNLEPFESSFLVWCFQIPTEYYESWEAMLIDEPLLGESLLTSKQVNYIILAITYAKWIVILI